MRQSIYVLASVLLVLITISQVGAVKTRLQAQAQGRWASSGPTPRQLQRIEDAKSKLVSHIDLQSVDVANIEKHIDTMYAAGQKLKAGIVRELERLSVQENLMVAAAAKPSELMTVWVGAQTSLVNMMMNIRPLLTDYTIPMASIPTYLKVPMAQRRPHIQRWGLVNQLYIRVLETVEFDKRRGMCAKVMCNRCAHATTCLEGRWNVTCVCQRGWAGALCDIEVDECKIMKCLNKGSCFTKEGAGMCLCPTGYGGALCELDMRRCEQNPCQNSGICVPPGYNMLNGTLVAKPKTAAAVVAQASEGGDEDGGEAAATAAPTMPPTISCMCAKGFAGESCEIDIDDCISSPCGNHGRCLDGPNTYTCMCDEGWAGVRCRKPVDPCFKNPCLNEGTCQRIGKGMNFNCVCPMGYGGKLCDILIDQCRSSPCEHGGTCFNDGTGKFTCKCPTGFGGPTCSQEISLCNAARCKNGGLCVEGVASYSCKCPPGFGGDQCEAAIDQCAAKPCLNGAKCLDKLSTYACLCNPGYNGTNCETNINECSPDPCENGSQCVDGINSYSCTCQQGYTGKNCEGKIDYCAANPCKNNGACVSSLQGFTCQCLKGFYGKVCDNGMECRKIPADDFYTYKATNNMMYPSTATFTCKAGYSAGDASLNRACNPDGTWEGVPPRCEPVTCTPVMTIQAPNSVVSASNGGKFPSVASYMCKDGYVTKDAIERFCTPDGHWNGKAPECVGMQCKMLSPPTHGSVASTNGNAFPATATYACDAGYFTADPATTICDSKGNWNGTKPNCEPITCTDLSLSASDAVVTLTNNGKYPSVATYKCKEGYQTVDSTTRTCLTDGSWTGRAPGCEGVPCPTLPDILGGESKVTFGGRYPGSISYLCGAGYLLQGPGERQCQRDGTWSGKESAKCVGIKCADMGGSIPGGSIAYSNDGRFPSTATYTCGPGFSLVGLETRSCASDGNWGGETPVCKPNPCTPPTNVTNGVVAASNNLEYPSTATYTCDTGFSLQGPTALSCLPTGAWDRSPPTCAPTVCAPLSAPTHGYLNVTNTYNYPSSATYTCEPGFRVDGSATRTCQPAGTWDLSAPTCVEINECLANPCRNGATCTDKVNDYSCACLEQGALFGGKNCDIAVNFLVPGVKMNSGAFITSTNGDFKLTQEANGKISVLKKTGTMVWTSSYVPPDMAGAVVSPVYWTELQKDGNLITFRLFRGRTMAVWATNKVLPSAMIPLVTKVSAEVSNGGVLTVAVATGAGGPSNPGQAPTSLTQFDSTTQNGCDLIGGAGNGCVV